MTPNEMIRQMQPIYHEIGYLKAAASLFAKQDERKEWMDRLDIIYEQCNKIQMIVQDIHEANKS